MKYDIFISYRRDGGEYTARILRDRLTDLGYSVFFDVETLRSGAFNTKLYEAIDECNDFLLILSPNALDRCVNDDDWVRREIEYALMKGKNVVPVLLRGFSFPKNLPKSLEQLPFCNGIEANSQFFDAFIEKLQEFLQSKPALSGQVSRLVKKYAPVLLAAVVLAALVFGGYTLWSSKNPDTEENPDAVHAAQISTEEASATGKYPHTRTEESLTEEVIAYIGENLAHLENMAEAKEDAYRAAREYLSSESASLSELQDTFYVSYTLINNEDVASAAVPDRLLDKLDYTESPFSSTDLSYMNETVLQFQQSSMNDIAYILSVADPENTLSVNEKQTIVSCYMDMLDAELNYHAICVNQFLLPITEESALESFWENTLTDLTHIPLESRYWSFDEDELKNSEEKCYNTMQNIVMELAFIVGESNVKIGQTSDTLVLGYVSQGYSQETAHRIVEDSKLDTDQMLQLYYWTNISEGMPSGQADTIAQLQTLSFVRQRSARLEHAALTSDDSDTLWIKMMRLISNRLYPEAHEAVDYYENKISKFSGLDGITTEHIPTLHAFIDNVESTGINYGVMVVRYTEVPHELLQIGDIIIAFNGEPCRTVDQYLTMKEELTEESYTVTVLRANTLEQVDLELTMDMPAIYMNSLTE